MSEESSSSNLKVSEALKELVVARIEARMPSNFKLSMGSGGSIDKAAMIEHVKKGDGVGEKIIRAHLSFMKAQASGQLTTALNTV